MAQIMTRMSLTWLGEPGQRVATKNTFKVVVLLVVSYMIYSTSLEVASLDYTPGTVPTAIVALKLVGSFLFGLWSLYRYVGKVVAVLPRHLLDGGTQSL